MKIKISQKGNTLQLDYDEKAIEPDFETVLLKTDNDTIYRGKLKKVIPLKDKVTSSQYIYLYFVNGDLPLFYTKVYYRTGDDSYLVLLKQQKEYFYVRLKNAKKNKTFINEFTKAIKGVIENVIK